ncbi:MAG: hypothetical protein M3T56_02070 [Chloroflexota bacterium]|nr:hypothetical protein [Chloroflexota bacterium]
MGIDTGSEGPQDAQQVDDARRRAVDKDLVTLARVLSALFIVGSLLWIPLMLFTLLFCGDAPGLCTTARIYGYVGGALVSPVIFIVAAVFAATSRWRRSLALLAIGTAFLAITCSIK